ncbi:YhcN/YlaJ family sporulation lipoprotein [Niallia sp. XMNu-256]|uniref:YhcN/YlaJ family sporulation lipoprotein n=1 Tax=Niallia sp. XMNu-256 TaxID=3082444 RepID=UPI0030D1A69D
MQQHKKTWMLCTLLSIGLVGCGTNDEAANNGLRQENDPMKIGYHSNESHDRNGGNVTILDGNDNDGPMTEMLDHSLGEERNTKGNDPRQGANIPSNYNEPLMGTSDRNYHGHLSTRQIPAGQKTYNRENQGNQSVQITKRVNEVNNVKEAQTIISDETIVIGVLLEKKEKADETKKNVQDTIQPYSKGKQVTVLTNESQFNRIKVINNDLKNGGPRDDLQQEINNIVNTNHE